MQQLARMATNTPQLSDSLILLHTHVIRRLLHAKDRCSCFELAQWVSAHTLGMTSVAPVSRGRNETHDFTTKTSIRTGYLNIAGELGGSPLPISLSSSDLSVVAFFIKHWIISIMPKSIYAKRRNGTCTLQGCAII